MSTRDEIDVVSTDVQQIETKHEAKHEHVKPHALPDPVVSLDIVMETLGAQNTDEAREIISLAYSYGLFIRNDTGIASVLADLDLSHEIEPESNRAIADILSWVATVDTSMP